MILNQEGRKSEEHNIGQTGKPALPFHGLQPLTHIHIHIQNQNQNQKQKQKQN
jgi:hypothetical protein